MKSDKVKVVVIGVAYSQLRKDVYVLALAEEGGAMRIPVIIGDSEAKSIAACLENFIPRRPMTHDLMVNICNSSGLLPVEVCVHKFEKGVFYANLVMRIDGQECVFDARISDAVAIALRMDIPIYVVREVMEKAGYDSSQTFSETEENSLEQLSNEALNARIEQAVAAENYEEAALIQQILKKRKL